MDRLQCPETAEIFQKGNIVRSLVLNAYIFSFFTFGTKVGIWQQALYRVYEEAVEDFILFSGCLHCSKSITSSQSLFGVGGIVNQLGVSPD